MLRKSIISQTLPILLLCFSFASAADLPDRHPLDKSEYRRLQLANGLKVLLLSDPKLNKSSASMAVSVGSLDDPEDREGLAHFLEHMLFLGTEKYPEVEDYGNYLKSNGGYSNAYTSGDLTNYHFEVSHDAFSGALDRFAQFFIAPLFSEEFTERELNAVNSEHQKNLEDDDWRSHHLIRIHFDKNHPENHFSTGNLDTLGDTKREQLIGFYNKYYSANQMTLAVTGSAGLDSLEDLVREYFSPIANNGKDRIHYPAKPLKTSNAVRLIKVDPIKDIRELNLMFALPSVQEHYESKPAELLSFILGYEGEGSLLSYLKEEGLATGLGASTWPATRDYSKFVASIDLTPKGLDNYKEVLQLFFAFIKNTKEEGYPEELFEERATMARLEELYSDKGEGADRAVFLANQLRDFPIEIAEREPYIYAKKDPKTFADLLEHLRPNNMLVQLVAKGVETDKEEPYYKAPYSYSETKGAFYNSLLNPPDIAGLFTPKTNPFIPKRVNLLPDIPFKVIDEKGITLYYSQDSEFQRPKVTLIYRINQSRASIDLNSAVLKMFYGACINEAINEIAYTAAAAGLSYAFTAGVGDVKVIVTGYDESALKLFKTIVDNMREFELSNERFEALKDRVVRGLENFPKSAAWQIARDHKRRVTNEFYFSPEDQLVVARGIELSDVRRYAKKLFAEGNIDGLVHGNMTLSHAIESLEYMKVGLRIDPIPEDEAYELRLLSQRPGDSVVDAAKLEVNNSCFWKEYFLGADTPKQRVASHVLGNFLANPFYSEMRTKQQLGYIVWGQTASIEDQLMAYFIIQSGEYAPDELQSRVAAFLETLPELFKELPDEQFELIKAGVKAKIEAKEKSIAEKATLLFSLAFDREEDWNRKSDSLAALAQLKKDDVAELISRITDKDKQATKLILLTGREHENKKPLHPSFTNTEKWKRQQSFK